MPPETIRDALDRVRAAYAALGGLGEEIEDEWSYVADLTDAWQTRLDAVAEQRGDEPVSAAAGIAVDRAIDEVGRIEDPHRAIDWLSTFPQVVLIALGERP